MAIPLRVLVLEDRAADAELILHELRQAGFDPDWRRVETEPDYLAHLDPKLDIILADYTLPQFGALRALHLLQECGLDIPFIVVTGSISEEVAVECMKKGAADYLLKDRLVRLGQAVTHALENKQLRLEHKRAEEERERLMTELAQKNNELEQLVYVTSHDLRSPLVNVQGFSKELQHVVQDLAVLLQSPEVPEHLRQKAAALVENDLQEDLHYILTSITKMDVLLSGLLKLSRLGRAALTITTLDMNQLIANVLTTFEFQMQEAGVNGEVAELPSCTGDATQINQVFSNLIDNALKYLDPTRPGIIKIEGDIKDDQAIYCVEDNGIGIAPEHQLQIFEIFHRLNPNHTPGEGLGLTIVRRMLERQGGKISVESEPGKGSKFYVSLPRG